MINVKVCEGILCYFMEGFLQLVRMCYHYHLILCCISLHLIFNGGDGLFISLNLMLLKFRDENIP